MSFKQVHRALNYKIYQTNIDALYRRYIILNKPYNFDKNYSLSRSIYCDDFLDVLVLSQKKYHSSMLEIVKGFHELNYAKKLHETTGKNLKLFIKIEQEQIGDNIVDEDDYNANTHY